MPNDYRNRSDRPRGEDYGRASQNRNPYAERDRERFDEHFRDDHDQGRGRFLSSATGYGEDYRYEGEPYERSNRYRDDSSDRDIRSAGFNSRPSERYERDDYFDRGYYRAERPQRTDYGRGYGSDTSFNSEMENARAGSARRDFTGRGPKGWKRSDERVKDDVSESLERHPDIDASEIEVSVKDGIVTLSGSVDHRRSKRLAEDLIDTIGGVKDVRNELTVNQNLFDQARELLTGHSVRSDRH